MNRIKARQAKKDLERLKQQQASRTALDGHQADCETTKFLREREIIGYGGKTSSISPTITEDVDPFDEAMSILEKK